MFVALRTRLVCCREGYEDFDKYGQRGMVSGRPQPSLPSPPDPTDPCGRGQDGGKNPDLEPAVNGYVSFKDSHVKAFFAGGSKSTPAPKMGVEVVGTTGR